MQSLLFNALDTNFTTILCIADLPYLFFFFTIKADIRNYLINSVFPVKLLWLLITNHFLKLKTKTILNLTFVFFFVKLKKISAFFGGAHVFFVKFD